MRHEFTPEERAEGASLGGLAKAAKYADLREQARQEAIVQLAGMSHKALVRLEGLLEAEGDSDAYRAVKDVLDRVLGRPTQAVEVTGKDEGPVEVEYRGVKLADVLNAAREAGLEPGNR